MRATLSAMVVGSLSLAAMGPATAGNGSKPQWIDLRVGMVEVSPTRANGDPWDDAGLEGEKCGLVTGAVSLLSATGWGPHLQKLCGPFRSQHNPDPRRPDLFLRLAAGAPTDYFSPIVRDTDVHDFAYHFLVPLSAVPEAGLRLEVWDQDGDAGAGAEPIGAIQLTAGSLVAMVSRPSKVATFSNSVVTVELTARPYKPATRKLTRRLAVGQGATRLPVDVLAGEQIELRASGSFTIRSGADRIGPHGTPGSTTGVNLPMEPFASAQHGAAVAIVGGRLDGVVVGRCARLVVPTSAGIVLGINDAEPSDDSGAISFQVSITRPSLDAWRTGTAGPVCDRQREIVSLPIVNSLQPLSDTSLDAGQVASIIRSRYLRGINRCHERLLETDPTAGGTVTVRLTVAPTGNVNKAAVTGLEPTFDSCLQSIASKWRFGAPKDDDGKPTSADFELSITLSAA